MSSGLKCLRSPVGSSTSPRETVSFGCLPHSEATIPNGISPMNKCFPKPTLSVAVLHTLGDIFLHINPSELQPHSCIDFGLQDKTVLVQTDNDYLMLSGMRRCSCAQVTNANSNSLLSDAVVQSSHISQSTLYAVRRQYPGPSCNRYLFLSPLKSRIFNC